MEEEEVSTHAQKEFQKEVESIEILPNSEIEGTDGEKEGTFTSAQQESSIACIVGSEPDETIQEIQLSHSDDIRKEQKASLHVTGLQGPEKAIPVSENEIRLVLPAEIPKIKDFGQPPNVLNTPQPVVTSTTVIDSQGSVQPTKGNENTSAPQPLEDIETNGNTTPVAIHEYNGTSKRKAKKTMENFDDTKFPILLIPDLLCTSIGQSTTGRFSMNKLFSITPDPRTWSSNIPTSFASSQIELVSESDIESLLITKDTLKWTNIFLLEESYITFENFPRFASQIGPQIQVLKLERFFGSVPEISFISCCISLKSLTIIQMDVKRGPRMFLPSEFPNLSKTFGGVKFLTIENIYFDTPKQLDFFKNFLARFPKLEHLSIPYPHGPNKAEWEIMKGLQSRFLIKPVVDYLNERHNSLNISGTAIIRRTINVGGVFSALFAELALACVKNGGYLTNVRQKQIENIFYGQDSALGKILHLNDALSDRRVLTKWINLETVILNTSACDIRGDFNKGSARGQLLFPHLKSIQILFDTDSKLDPGFESVKWLLQLLLGQVRLTVKELKIQWVPYGHDTPHDVITGASIVLHLPNLVQLHISNWKAEDDELILMLSGLRRLQRLAIEDCRNFTENAFIGSDEGRPVLASLKDLKHLEIVNRHGSSLITDKLFENVIQDLSLTTFVCDICPNQVSEDAYWTLAFGKFALSIQTFPEPKYLAFDKQIFYEIRKQMLRKEDNTH